MRSITEWLVKPRGILEFSLAVVIIISVNLTVFALLSPVKALKQVNNMPTENTLQQTSRFAPTPEISRLIREKAFYESRLKMAKTDSLVLSVNLPDSILSVEIMGIPIHTIPLNKFETPDFFRLIDNKIVQTRFSEPQQILNAHATTLKEPIRVVHAPKDTNEYNTTVADNNYDTARLRLSFVEYETNEKIRLLFIPIDERSLRHWRTDFAFNIKLSWRSFKQNLKASLQFKVPEYYPIVKIYLPHSDIESIHRALPENALVSIHLN